jgi:CsoR family transcriptional regulator, copper-sensing transcriptional repressor
MAQRHGGAGGRGVPGSPGAPPDRPVARVVRPYPSPGGVPYSDGMIPEHKREALLRLKTVRGHLDGVIGMVDQEVYCPDLMKQVAAMQASLEKVNRVLLQNHLETCVTEAIQAGGGEEKIRELLEALRYNASLTDFRDRAEPLPLPGEAPAEATA